MQIPANVLLFWPSTNASIPSGWTRETSYDDRFPKGWGDDDPADTGGANSHSHTGDTHTHTRTDNHGHVVAFAAINNSSSYGGSGNFDPIAQNNHDHPDFTINGISGGDAADAITYPASSNNNHPPYMRMIFIKASAGAVVEDSIVGLWNSATVPGNWLACTDGGNGAPAMGNRYIRGAAAGGNGGSTGGSLTHSHTLDHSHSTSHTHSGNSSTDDNHPIRENSGGSGGNKTGSHTHTVTLTATSVTTDTYTGSVTSGDTEPVYKKLLAIQKQTGGATPKGLIGLWLGSVGSIPKNWQLCDGSLWPDGVNSSPDMRNYHLKIANATSEIGNTGGANTHSHSASNSHSHSESAVHTHSAVVGSAGNTTQSGGSTSNPAHTHTVNSVGNNNATMTWGSASMSAQSTNHEPEYTVAAFIQLVKIPRGVRLLEI